MESPTPQQAAFDAAMKELPADVAAELDTAARPDCQPHEVKRASRLYTAFWNVFSRGAEFGATRGEPPADEKPTDTDADADKGD